MRRACKVSSILGQLCELGVDGERVAKQCYEGRCRLLVLGLFKSLAPTIRKSDRISLLGCESAGAEF